MTQTTPKLGLPLLAVGQADAEAQYNAAMALCEQISFATVISIANSPAGGETNGQAYLVGSSPTGAFATFTTGQIAYLSNGAWIAFTPTTGAPCYVQNQGALYFYTSNGAWDATTQFAGLAVCNDHFSFSIEEGITASSTQTQGQRPLTKTVNIVSVCATTNDVVTLPAVTNSIVNLARAGATLIVSNQGANTLQIFPATGKAINGGSTNASITLAATKSLIFITIAGGYRTLAF